MRWLLSTMPSDSGARTDAAAGSDTDSGTDYNTGASAHTSYYAGAGSHANARNNTGAGTHARCDSDACPGACRRSCDDPGRDHDGGNSRHGRPDDDRSRRRHSWVRAE